jgi:thiol:disulfide interchange protein DsbD
MRQIIFTLLFLSGFCVLKAQVIEPARLVAETPTGTYKVGDEVELVFKATIDNRWYIYSVGFDPDCGPIPMAVTLEKNPGYELVGDLKAVNDKAKHDKIFDCDVRIFEGTGEFRQKIKFLASNVTLKGSYEGQVCSEVEGKCVLFDGDLNFGAIKVEGAAKVTPKKNNDEGKPQAAAQPERIDTGTIRNELPLPAQVQYGENKGPILDPSLITSDPRQNSFIGFFLLSFVAGLAALLTPCVFPMIP